MPPALKNKRTPAVCKICTGFGRTPGNRVCKACRGTGLSQLPPYPASVEVCPRCGHPEKDCPHCWACRRDLWDDDHVENCPLAGGPRSHRISRPAAPPRREPEPEPEDDFDLFGED